MAALKEKILGPIRAMPGLTDRAISDQLLGSAAPQQGVNQIARSLDSAIRSKPGRQLVIAMPAMADGDKANRACFAVDRVDDPKAANAKRPQAVEVAEQRLAALRVGGDGANRRLDRTLQIGME
jgi:hypothetical protein